MSCDAVFEPAFTLWLETLPTGDTARLLVQPRGNQVYTVFYWNQQLHNRRCFTSRATAERWGYELHRVLQEDLLAGVLLGYDSDVLDHLQTLCSP